MIKGGSAALAVVAALVLWPSAVRASEDDARQIQNLMSRRAIYQARGDAVSWLALFSARQADVSFYLAGQMTVGLDKIRERFGYGLPTRDAFTEHALSSPIIEIAADCLTAKGLWQTFGPVIVPDGKHPLSMLAWENSGVDFIKEDGVWKIWHFAVFTDFQVGLGRTLRQKLADDRREPASPGPYHPWQPGGSAPRFPLPVPFRTFSETFSYGKLPDARRQAQDAGVQLP